MSVLSKQTEAHVQSRTPLIFNRTQSRCAERSLYCAAMRNRHAPTPHAGLSGAEGQPVIPPCDLWVWSPDFKSRDRNSSLVTRSPLAHIACQVLSSVFQSSSVTRIARSLFRGSPDLGLAMLYLLFDWFFLNSLITTNKIIVEKTAMSS